MRLPKLEFKKRQERKVQQWWKKMWGIDFETQKEIKSQCQSACDDFISCIKVGSDGSRKICRGEPNICWPLTVAGHLVMGDNFGSRSRSVVIHIVS